MVRRIAAAGWLCAGLVLMGQAALAEDREPAEVGRAMAAQAEPADMPPAIVGRAEAPSDAPALRATLVDELRLPEPPPVAVLVEVPAPPAIVARPRVGGGNAVSGLLLPEAPPVVVSLSAAEAASGALEGRLADPRLGLPRRFPSRDREALAGFYKARNFRPLWIGQEGWSVRAQALMEQLRGAAEDGLDPADYPVPAAAGDRRAALDLQGSPAEQAEAEIRLTVAAYLYARDARGGRIDPSRLSGLMTPKLDLPGLAAVLARLAGDEAPDRVLASYQPAYPQYQALRARLAALRATHPAAPVARAPGRALRPGRDIAALGDLDSPVLVHPSPARLEGDLVANMERWRWLPAEVAPRYVLVNIPEFRLSLVEDGRQVHETRVITGRPETPTPIVSGILDRAVINPSWHIPPSIMKNEILPGLARDPSYAARRGYEVIRRGKSISVRQPPGERNALGLIKFLFPNQHAVYLHDTPNRGLFASGRRAFSHGCVRVENPFRLADALLGRQWDERRLRGLVGRGERTIPMATPLPVHFAYFTVEVDASGALRTHDDLYGYNRRVRTALGLGG